MLQQLEMSPPPVASKVRTTGRIPSLDGFRGAAALLIVLDHAQHDVFPSAMIGVDVFFVLSGFLITGVVLNEWQRTGNVSLRHFYMRRVLRLYPALVLTVLVSNFIFHHSIGHYLAASGRALGYVTNLYIGFGGGPGALDQTWSLGVEEQFYILWPIALVISLRIRRAMPLAIAVLIGSAVAHAATVVWCTPAAAYMLPTSRFDQLMAGVVLALVVRTSWGTKFIARWFSAPAAWAGVCAIAVLAVLPDHHGYYELVRMWGVAGISVVIIGHLTSRQRGSLVSLAASRPAVWVGERSYGLYLLHVLVIGVIATHIHWRPALRLPLVIVASLLVAAICYAAVEQPFLKLKRRFA